MKKKLVSFVCAVMAALCLAVSVPVQAYAETEDEIALKKMEEAGVLYRAPGSGRNTLVFQRYPPIYTLKTALPIAEGPPAPMRIIPLSWSWS